MVLDPFAGAATTLIAAQAAGAASVGFEAHPLVHRIGRAKLDWSSDPARFEDALERALLRAEGLRPRGAPAALLEKIYTPQALERLLAIRAAVEALEEGPAARLCWLAFLSALRACSGAGTAPWQYVLPKKRKARAAEPFAEVRRRARAMAEDMRGMQRLHEAPPSARLIRGDARELRALPDGSVDLVVGSPPYPNNFDYADATRVELSVLGQVAAWKDLHQAARRHLIRSCSQHAAREKIEAEALLDQEALRPIREPLARACRALAIERGRRAGRKRYDAMVAAYFADMSRALAAMARVMRPGARACLVIGDSAPYGVHVRRRPGWRSSATPWACARCASSRRARGTRAGRTASTACRCARGGCGWSAGAERLSRAAGPARPAGARR